MTNGPNDAPDQSFSLIDWIVADATVFVTPLLEAASSPAATASLLANIGWQVDALPALATLVSEVSAAVDTALSALHSAAGAAESGPAPATALAMVQKITGLIQAISAAVAGFSQAGAWQDAPQGLANLAEDMLAWLTDNYLLTAHPLLHGAMALLQLLTPQAAAPEQPAVLDSGGQVLRAAYRLPALHLNRLGALLQDPAAYLRTAYLAAGSLITPTEVQQLADTLFPVVADALNSFGLGASYGLDPYFDQLGLDPASSQILQHGLSVWILDSDDADATVIGATLALVGPDASTGGRVGAVIAPTFPTSIDGTVGGWRFSAGLTAGGAPLSAISWVPYPADPSSWPGLGLSFTLTSGRASDIPAGTGAPTSPAARVVAQVSVHNSTFEASLSLSLQASVSLSPADLADGFLQEILPSDGIVIPLGLTLSGSRDGWKLEGSAPKGTAIVFAKFPPITAGPLIVEDLRFQGIPGDAGLTAGGYLTASLSLGPIVASVQDLGVGLEAQWPATGGNVGPLNLVPKAFWPTGVGMSIDAPVVSGGGFLAFDEANGRYLGALALSAGPVSVQGVGVLTTKLPGGGWSLIALANVDGLALQLGFGIELTGLGVLVGVNRTMNVAALQSLARSGGLTTVMFPADLAANAPRVAADLDGLFPPAQGQYVFGPTVQLTWGTGSLITGELAVYVELPSPLRVAVLGALQLMLPDPDEPVVQLNLDLLGVIDLTAKTVALDMSLAHSALAGMPLTGQAALRAGWGDQPAFLLAAGGWHPSFVAPAGFPALQRMGLSMGGGDLQLRLAAYLAVTTNTVQLGAAIDLRAAAGPAAFTATVSFDALVQFKPFGLELDLAICAAVTLGGDPVLSLNITVHLSGPSPWHMAGQAQFSILWFSFTIPISGTFGTAVTPVTPAPADIFGPLAAAIADPHSWILPSPPGPPVVTLRNGSAGAAVHPLGSLTLQQRVIPLEQHIDRFGADILPAPTTVSLSAGGSSTSANGVPGIFAPAQFVTMTDAQKLSAPSFQALTAGFTIGAAGLVVPVAGGISATSPQAAPAYTTSDADWDPLVIDYPPVPAAAGAAGAPAGGSPVRTIVITAPAGMQVPGEVLAAQLPDAAAAVCGTAAMGAGAYPRIRTGIGPQLPQYAIASLGMVNQTQDRPWFGAQVTAAAAAGPGQQAVYLSELSSG